MKIDGADLQCSDIEYDFTPITLAKIKRIPLDSHYDIQKPSDLFILWEKICNHQGKIFVEIHSHLLCIIGQSPGKTIHEHISRQYILDPYFFSSRFEEYIPQTARTFFRNKELLMDIFNELLHGLTVLKQAKGIYINGGNHDQEKVDS